MSFDVSIVLLLFNRGTNCTPLSDWSNTNGGIISELLEFVADDMMGTKGEAGAGDELFVLLILDNKQSFPKHIILVEVK